MGKIRRDDLGSRRFMKRLLSKVDVHPDGCWIWRGAITNGYGHILVDGVSLYAHRALYESEYGPIPDGKMIHHLCHNQLCVNPGHMKLVTASEHPTIPHVVIPHRHPPMDIPVSSVDSHTQGFDYRFNYAP